MLVTCIFSFSHDVFKASLSILVLIEIKRFVWLRVKMLESLEMYPDCLSEGQKSVGQKNIHEYGSTDGP